jgi:quinol monooxygenase YgiN
MSAMYIQVVTFQLKDLSQEAFEADCDETAPAFAAVPGLIAKVWLADPTTNTYGGVYTWESRSACEAYLRSELFAAVASHPNLVAVTSREFAVLAGPTRVTRGLVGATA